MTFRPHVGATVDERFRLHEQLNSGGFATVWHATDLETGTAVALKCGREATHDRETVRTQFRKELRCFHRLESPLMPGGLVQFVDGAVEDSPDDGETVYVATELIEGESLDSLASPGMDALVSVGKPLCAAFEYIHECGISYLDLKPNNVIRRRRGPPALVDFNAAVLDDQAPLFHQDGFKPPELTPPDGDGSAGPASDVYSLGALLIYLLTGEPRPATAVEGGGPLDPVELGGDPDAPVIDVLRTATARDPGERFRDASAFYAALAPHIGVDDTVAHLTAPGDDRRLSVRSGATVGRWTTDGPVPTVVLADPGEHLSAEHVILKRRQGWWYLEDWSLNGTFVDTDEGLAYIVSRDGLTRQREAGRTPAHPNPADAIRLADGDRIAPVALDYGAEMTFFVE